jgi:2-polyprenyl-6-methoxyphenol hydroxylase-like FAD-dependent oxidoreductase
MTLKVAVIGGGIGGLSTILAMLQQGFDVHVYEQAPKFGEVGAGIQISPNASRLLHRLGVEEAMQKWEVMPTGVHQRHWDDGRMLQRAPLGTGVEAAFGAPTTTRRIALLGYACHPMLPVMAQGAAQAIEDGAALASLSWRRVAIGRSPH